MEHSKPALGLRFTPEQRATLTTFTERHPCGFRIEIVSETSGAPEIAEVWRHDRSLPLFFLTPLPNGAVEVYDVVHEIYETDTIGSVLARLQTVLNGRGPGLFRKLAPGD